MNFGLPTPLQPLDIQNPENEALLLSTAAGQKSANTLRTRYTPVRFGVICLIQEIQRERKAREMAAWLALRAEAEDREPAMDVHPKA
jgi:hypothetical protein